MCCFCGETITRRAGRPMEVTITLGGDQRQFLLAHHDCLGDRLHPDVSWMTRREWDDLEEDPTT